jgi:molybdenum cofactor synthesis domain-containing protein
MTTSGTSTAAILIIGNEILSGKTQDANTPWLALRLAEHGIKLCEVRVVRDEENAIVTAVRALKQTYTYVFTTGGIGPTHDDITAACMAKAFHTPLIIHAEALNRLGAYYKAKGQELNDARLRMAHTPEGADLIDNPVSIAPGFKIGNVYVMAGVPNIMQAMFAGFAQTLKGGPPVLSRSVKAHLRESDIAAGLEAIQKEYPALDIGSYPNMQAGHPETNLVLRGTDEIQLDAATQKVAHLVEEKTKLA